MVTQRHRAYPDDRHSVNVYTVAPGGLANIGSDPDCSAIFSGELLNQLALASAIGNRPERTTGQHYSQVLMSIAVFELKQIVRIHIDLGNPRKY